MNSSTQIIADLGGAGAVARTVGVAITTVRRWTYPVGRGGTGGTIPLKYWPALMRMAQTMNVQLTADRLAGACTTPRAEHEDTARSRTPVAQSEGGR